MLFRLKTYFENMAITPVSWLIGISGILMVRFFMEALSSPSSTGFLASDASTLVHYYLFFLSFAVTFMIFLWIFLKEWRQIIPQIAVFSFIAVFIAPILDFIISGGKGFSMSYLFNTSGEILSSFFSFFGPFLPQGITLGIRLEVLIILFFVLALVYKATKNFKKSLLAFLVFYLITFIFLSLPSFISIIGNAFGSGGYFNEPLNFFQNAIQNSSTASNNIHSSLRYGSAGRFFEMAFNFSMSKILFLALTAFSFIWFYLSQKEKFKAIIANSRPERVAHYMFMIAIGVVAAFRLFPEISLNWNDWLSLIVLALSFYFSWMFAVCVNDIVDEDIDEVTNTERPLVKNEVSKNDMKQASLLFLVASLLAGFLAGYGAFFFILAFTSLYYIYSAPPTRFKTIPFFSSFLIGLCCLTAALAGFFTVSPVKNVASFPASLAVAIVVIFFLWSHVRDMKDIEGDKKAGIPTVPVIFGDRGPRVVAVLSSLGYLLVPIFANISFLWLPSLVAAFFNYYFIVKKPYSEKSVFRIYQIFAIILAVVYFI